MAPWAGEGWGSTATVTAPTSPVGLITNFSAITGTLWNIDGAYVKNDNANESGGTKPWVIQQLDNFTVRYEARNGDHWAPDGATGNNRDETGFCLANGAALAFNQDVEVDLDYKLTVLAGTTNTSGFVSFTQIHAVVNSPPAPFYLNFDAGDKLSVIIQNPSSTFTRVGQTASPLVRGQEYSIQAKVLMNPSAGGYARVWIDGLQIANYTGAIGANSSQYWWKFGIYRQEVPETLAITLRNINISSS